MARDGPATGTIAGAIIGAVAAVILILLCSLPFLLKCRRKRRLRKRQEHDEFRPSMATAGARPPSHTFSPHANRLCHVSQSRLASAAATLSDRDSQTAKEYGPDGITFHRSAAPSPALVGKTLRTCSPAPSIAMAAGSRNNSPAVAQAPFVPPAEEKEMGRTPTFGTMTTEPEPISRSPTSSNSQHESQSPSIGGTFRKFHDKVFHRVSTRSSGSESRKTGSRSMDVDLDELDRTQTGASAAHLVYEKIPMGGAAEEYYSGAPLSPPDEPPVPASSAGDSGLLHLVAMPGATLAGIAAPHTHVSSQQQQHQRSLGSPFDAAGVPLSPTSPLVKDEDLSSEEGGRRSLEAKGDSLSPPRGGLPSPSPERFEPPPSPSHPAPGTVNPMDMMKPSTAAEQAAWVDTELWKLENSPPPQLESSPSRFEPSPSPSQSGPSPQSQPQPYQPHTNAFPPSQPDPTVGPERPHFQAVVRHPTQMDITATGQAVPQHEEQVITEISDSSSPGTGFDRYAYGPSSSNHTTPETGLTGSAYTGTPSPRSSTSRRPSSYDGTGKMSFTLILMLNARLTCLIEYLEPAPGDLSRPSSQGDGSPKPTSFACDICGSKFDQVHKLKYVLLSQSRPKLRLHFADNPPQPPQALP